MKLINNLGTSYGKSSLEAVNTKKSLGAKSFGCHHSWVRKRIHIAVFRSLININIFLMIGIAVRNGVQ
jgi:hypothetical protein